MDYHKAAQDIKAVIDSKDMDGLARFVAPLRDEARNELRRAFRAQNGKELADYFDGVFKNGDYKDLMMIVLDDEITVRCKLLKKAFKGGNDEDCITDILLTTSPEIYAQMKERYNQLFGGDLDAIIQKEIGSKSVWARMIHSWLMFCRAARNDPEGDARALQKALLIDKKNDDGVAIRLLGTSMPGEWEKISACYEKLTNKTIEQTLIEEYKGDHEVALCCCNAYLFSPGRGAAYLMSLANAGKGDTARCCRITGLLYDQSEMCRYQYAHYGNLAKDLRKTQSKNLAEACCVLWGVM